MDSHFYYTPHSPKKYKRVIHLVLPFTKIYNSLFSVSMAELNSGDEFVLEVEGERSEEDDVVVLEPDKRRTKVVKRRKRKKVKKKRKRRKRESSSDESSGSESSEESEEEQPKRKRKKKKKKKRHHKKEVPSSSPLLGRMASLGLWVAVLLILGFLFYFIVYLIQKVNQQGHGVLQQNQIPTYVSSPRVSHYEKTNPHETLSKAEMYDLLNNESLNDLLEDQLNSSLGVAVTSPYFLKQYQTKAVARSFQARKILMFKIAKKVVLKAQVIPCSGEECPVEENEDKRVDPFTTVGFTTVFNLCVAHESATKIETMERTTTQNTHSESDVVYRSEGMQIYATIGYEEDGEWKIYEDYKSFGGRESAGIQAALDQFGGNFYCEKLLE